jgi:acyl-CoA thioester hydrolase
VSEVQDDRFLMLYRIASESAGGALAAEGDGLIVSYDYRQKRKAPLPGRVRERIAELEGGKQGRSR